MHKSIHFALQVHTVAELERVLLLSPELLDPATTLLGINNRDLETFEVTLENTAIIMASAAGQEVRSVEHFYSLHIISALHPCLML